MTSFATFNGIRDPENETKQLLTSQDRDYHKTAYEVVLPEKQI